MQNGNNTTPGPTTVWPSTTTCETRRVHEQVEHKIKGWETHLLDLLKDEPFDVPTKHATRYGGDYNTLEGSLHGSLKKAIANLGVVSLPTGKNGKLQWHLPQNAPTAAPAPAEVGVTSGGTPRPEPAIVELKEGMLMRFGDEVYKLDKISEEDGDSYDTVVSLYLDKLKDSKWHAPVAAINHGRRLI